MVSSPKAETANARLQQAYSGMDQGFGHPVGRVVSFRQLTSFRRAPDILPIEPGR